MALAHDCTGAPSRTLDRNYSLEAALCLSDTDITERYSQELQWLRDEVKVLNDSLGLSQANEVALSEEIKILNDSLAVGQLNESALSDEMEAIKAQWHEEVHELEHSVAQLSASVDQLHAELLRANDAVAHFSSRRDVFKKSRHPDSDADTDSILQDEDSHATDSSSATRTRRKKKEESKGELRRKVMDAERVNAEMRLRTVKLMDGMAKASDECSLEMDKVRGELRQSEEERVRLSQELLRVNAMSASFHQQLSDLHSLNDTLQRQNEDLLLALNEHSSSKHPKTARRSRTIVRRLSEESSVPSTFNFVPPHSYSHYSHSRRGSHGSICSSVRSGATDITDDNLFRIGRGLTLVDAVRVADDSDSDSSVPESTLSRTSLITKTSATRSHGSTSVAVRLPRIDVRDVMKEYLFLTATAVRLKHATLSEVLSTEDLIARTKHLPFYNFHDAMVAEFNAIKRLREAMEKQRRSKKGEDTKVRRGKRKLRKRVSKKDALRRRGAEAKVVQSMTPVPSSGRGEDVSLSISCPRRFERADSGTAVIGPTYSRPLATVTMTTMSSMTPTLACARLGHRHSRSQHSGVERRTVATAAASAVSAAEMKKDCRFLTRFKFERKSRTAAAFLALGTGTPPPQRRRDKPLAFPSMTESRSVKLQAKRKPQTRGRAKVRKEGSSERKSEMSDEEIFLPRVRSKSMSISRSPPPPGTRSTTWSGKRGKAALKKTTAVGLEEPSVGSGTCAPTLPRKRSFFGFLGGGLGFGASIFRSGEDASVQEEGGSAAVALKRVSVNSSDEFVLDDDDSASLNFEDILAGYYEEN